MTGVFADVHNFTRQHADPTRPDPHPAGGSEGHGLRACRVCVR